MAITSPLDTVRLELAPRYSNQGYDSESVRLRREWVANKTASQLSYVGSVPIPTMQMRGNIENPIGVVQVPLGIAGPLLVKGNHANGLFYVPLATTEGALVRSYERGMAVLTHAGGVDARVSCDGNCVAPTFFFNDVVESFEFARSLSNNFPEIREQAESTTQYGKLLAIEPMVDGRNVIVVFRFYTADAHGMNMIVKATDRACNWIANTLGARGYQLFSGFESEKHASGALFAGRKGKKVTAGALIPAEMLQFYLRSTPMQFIELWQHTVVGHIHANSIGYNGHFANGLAAIFIACGQDIGNIPNCSAGLTHFELTAGGDLYASVTLASLTVGTVGGGTGLGTARECLSMLGCYGPGLAPKFAEVVAAALLAGELSIGGALISGEFVTAHESYGRNRPVSPSR